MIKTAWIHKNNGSGKNEQRTILQGGFKNPKGETEAMSAYCFAKTRYPFSELSFVLEKKSFRTHNNALEGLDIISKRFPKIGVISLVGHPIHMARVALCYEIANRLFHDNRYTIIKFPSKEIYDPLVYRQEYWVDDQIFAAREKKVMILYRFLLFRPWARLGFWVLKNIWPSHKQ
ncbi:MAG: ElyC/SanA/YdcF family protein [Patescibacteria group bacterium]